MTGVDTNLLVYAHRRDSEWHTKAAEVVRSLAEGAAAWAIPWPCVHEFIAIVTHPRIYDPPSTLTEVFDQLAAWMASPSLRLLSESGRHAETLRDVAFIGRTSGPKVHDARVAAICIDQGIDVLLSADRDFSRFPRVAVANPLLES